MNGMTVADAFPSAAAWRRMAPMLLLMALVLLVLRDSAAAMVAIWNRSDTFAHAYLVAPISLWLVWRRRARLAQLAVRPMPWVLLTMAAMLLLWLAGELVGVNAATQFALVALLVLAVPATLGPAVARALTFPLLFLFFMVPIGEFMVPTMMDWTADFAAAAVRLSGVPIYREGLQFVIPSGQWSVVQACSGVRYLIASFMVGTLFAYLNFQTPWRRGVFILLSLLTPIVANWVRAYLIVMIGHLSDNRLAAGVDHIIYGWVFFGLVIGALFMLGARYAEAEVQPAAAPDSARGASGPVLQTSRLATAWPVVAAAALLLLGVQGLLLALDRGSEGPAPALNLSAQIPPGWHVAARPVSAWVPAYADAVVQAVGDYSNGAAEVGLRVAYYRHQGHQRKLVTSTNTLVDTQGHDGWAQVSSQHQRVDIGPTGALSVQQAELRGSPEPGSLSAQRLRVWQLYWIDGVWTSSATRARAHLALNRLLGRGDDGAALFFYTPIDSPGGVAAADAALGRFVPAAWPALARVLAQAQQER